MEFGSEGSFEILDLGILFQTHFMPIWLGRFFQVNSNNLWSQMCDLKFCLFCS